MLECRVDIEDIDVPTRLGSLHVRVAGSGDPILMWPSLLMDATLWDRQVEHFSPQHRTVAVDPPGHGRSDGLDRDFTFDECAQCVVDILDHLGLPRAHLLGNSWGAMIGGTFAARFPDRVGCVVLMNGTASPAPRAQRVRYAALLSTARVLGGIRPPLTGPVARAFLGPTTRSTRPDVVRRVLDVAARNDVRSATHAVRSVVMRRPDQRALFGTITCPALVVAGREDVTFRLPELETMAGSIPGAEFTVVEGAAHLAAAEVPDVVNDLVETFLARHA